ncbi:MAG TPA: hypothetical protein VGR82_14355 [Methylomirabilota bacterium]|jgi:hypothetical protein|nr:hypothetical protein [Methylomirabilota bacterium]
MARARKSARGKRRRRPPPAKPTDAERRLLALARELGGRDGDPWPGTLRALAAAYAPDAPLPRAVGRAWLASRRDKTAALALAWAREQVRLALQEIIEATPPAERRPLAMAPELLAWLLLAGCEALAQEPPSAVADRVRALAALTGRDGGP